MSSTTFGVAVLLASAYHDDDKELFKFISDSIDIGTITASTFQLAHMLLYTFPKGKLSEPQDVVDIRDEAFDVFSDYVSSAGVKASAWTGADPQNMVTALSTIIMGSIVPILENREPNTVDIEQEGLDADGMIVVMATIAEASIHALRSYVGLINIMPELGSNPSYPEVSNRLLDMVPRLSFYLDR